MEAVHRIWLTAEIGVAVDMGATHTLASADTRQQTEGMSEGTITSPMPIAAKLRIRPVNTKIAWLPLIMRKALAEKIGQTEGRNIGQ